VEHSERQELLDAVAMTRQALKGLLRQARQTMQLATDLEERLAARETEIRNRTANGGTANDHEDEDLAHRQFAVAI
jgi:hypothetical protein